MSLDDRCLASWKKKSITNVLDHHPRTVCEQHRIVVVPGAKERIEPELFLVAAEDFVFALVETRLVDQKAARLAWYQPTPHHDSDLMVFERVE